jgi:outer membrane protein assembly factor BamB
MPAKTPRFLYVGIKGRVLAIHRESGEVAWESRLKGSSMVSVLVEDGRIFATSKGEVFCLDAATGAQLWHNPLPGLGTDLASLATASGGSSSVLMQQAQQQQQQAATAAVIAAT